MATRIALRSLLLAASAAVLSGCSSPAPDAPTPAAAGGGTSAGASGSSGAAGTLADAGSDGVGGGGGGELSMAGGSSGASGAGGSSALPVDWFDPAWTKRFKVTVSDPQLNEQLQQFQVPVRLEAQSFDSASAKPAGEDLRFVTTDGEVLKHEIEKWDATGESLIWLLLPQLGAAPLELWLYSGNPQASAPTEPDRRAVWPEPYTAVWHLAGGADDSGPNAYGAQNKGGTFEAGMLGQGMRLSRPNKQYVVISPNSPIPLVSGASGSTFSAWVHPEGIDGGPGDGSDQQTNGSIILTIGGHSTGNHNSYCDHNINYEGRMISHIDPADQGGYKTLRSDSGSVPRGEWSWLTYVIDLAAGNEHFYKNGVEVGTITNGAFNATAYAAEPSLQVVIGTEEDLTKHFWDGGLDELRIEKGTRSAAWIAAQYRAMTTQDYVSVSAE